MLKIKEDKYLKKIIFHIFNKFYIIANHKIKRFNYYFFIKIIVVFLRYIVNDFNSFSDKSFLLLFLSSCCRFFLFLLFLLLFLFSLSLFFLLFFSFLLFFLFFSFLFVLLLFFCNFSSSCFSIKDTFNFESVCQWSIIFIIFILILLVITSSIFFIIFFFFNWDDSVEFHS